MPWELCYAAAENAAKNGVDIMLRSEVTGIDRASGGGFTIQAGNKTYNTKAIINCAGLSADKLHEMATEPTVRIVPTAGDYYILDTKVANHIRHIIFHEPEEKGKGLTLVPTVDGNILVGPTEREYIGEAENGDLEIGSGFATEREGLDLLRTFVSEVIPSLPMEHIINSFGAARPNPYMLLKDENGNWVTEDKSVSDFCIIDSEEGAFISLVGVKTPGLTCSAELGAHIAKKMASRLGAAPNTGFDPFRPKPVRLSELSPEVWDSLIKKNPDYGSIVCRCGNISEGEVVDAIRRFPGAVTLGGVKRRTGTESGRCQGGFCTQRIIEILAREMGCVPEDIERDGTGSKILIESRFVK